MGEEHGIKELKEVVVFLAGFASAADAATRNGLDVNDIATFMPAMMMAPAAFTGLDKAKLELGNLDQAELQELRQAVADSLDLVDDKVEALVEYALSVALSLYDLIEQFKALKAA